MQKKVKTIIIGNVFALLISFIMMWPNVLEVADLALYDYNLIRSKTHQAHEDLLVIAIDEHALQTIGEPWPWRRSIYGNLIEQMNEPGYEAAAIAFDMLFVTTTDPGEDAYFADVLAKHDNVILPLYSETQNRFSYLTRGKKDELISVGQVIAPLPILEAVSVQAHINALKDSDGVIRRNWLKLNTPQGEVTSMAYAAVEMAGYDLNHYLDYHPQTEIAIKFDLSAYNVETVSFVDVLNGNFHKQNFKDRIVFVGFTAVGVDGQDSGPVPGEKDMQLVYVHVNIANQLLENKHISFVHSNVTSILIIIMLALAMLYTWRLRTIPGLIALFATIGAVIVGQYVLFSTQLTYIVTVYPLFALFIAYLINIALKSFYENKQKQFITKQFGRYISPDLVQEIVASDEEIQLGGVNKELSILFLDIRGFTTLSEKLKPEMVVDLLNKMFNLITSKVLENKGTIDKFIGDAAMIIFNAPLDLEHHEYYAVKTAYDIQQGMAQVRSEVLEQHGVEVNVGIGINTGEVVIGNIGSYIRMDYTAIGDHVNVAARIEANTEANQIFVSEQTYERTKEYFEYEFIGEVMMKGKTVPIKLYEVHGIKQILS